MNSDYSTSITQLQLYAEEQASWRGFEKKYGSWKVMVCLWINLFIYSCAYIRPRLKFITTSEMVSENLYIYIIYTYM
jgi:hypothetical protein